MLDFVYVVNVKFINENAISKGIQKRRVIKFTPQYVTIDDYVTPIKVPAKRCFVEPKKAVAECECLSQELISKLETRIKDLKKTVDVPQKISGSLYEWD